VAEISTDQSDSFNIVRLDTKPPRGLFFDDLEYHGLVNWFRTNAWPATCEGNSRTYLSQTSETAVGFLVLATTNAHLNPVRYPNNRDSLVLLIARLYVCPNNRRQGIGRKAIDFAISVATILNDTVGCRGLVVDANKQAIEFYQRLGFKSLDEAKPERMYFPIPSAF